MKCSSATLCFLLLLLKSVSVESLLPAQETSPEISSLDLYSDTWVATDGLGRSMPDSNEAGAVKNDKQRVVSIFYITWHTDNLAGLKSPYRADVTSILHTDPAARLDAAHPLWTESMYHWAEPEMGYFLSKDEYVIRKDMSMLSDAGVDVLIMDVTNAVRYWSEWDTLFTVMQQMKREGNRVPRFCFWAFNGPVITVVQDLYDRIYKTGRYSDLWFYWEGKPLLLYNGNPKYDASGTAGNNPNPHYDPAAATDPSHPHYGEPDYTEPRYKDYTSEVKRFFTLRTMWWGYKNWGGAPFIGTEDNWSFGYDLGDPAVRNLDPDLLVSRHNGQKEQAAVTPAQHPSSLVGKSWSRSGAEPQLNQYDLPQKAYVPWLGDTVQHPEGYGIYFQERWDEALKSDPPFIYLNDWNEWTAGKYPPTQGKTTPFMRRESGYFFVDQYNSEFNRGIQPMKGGYTDNYYMQMAQNIRRYKGVRDIPQLSGYSPIRIDGAFSDWDAVPGYYRDTRGDVFHRSHKGYGQLYYKNSSGRNDIVDSKVAVDRRNLYFYVETASVLSSCFDENWMLLLIDADKNPKTGWYGYDFVVNRKVLSACQSTLLRYDGDTGSGRWVQVSEVAFRYAGKKLEITIPRALLKLTGSLLVFDFKWSDNASEWVDPISFCTHGDTAPNRRFAYRCIWKR